MDSRTLTVEFRVPVPRGPVGGHGEVVMRRDEPGTGWAGPCPEP